VYICEMKSKWKIDIKGLENFRFGEDKELYRLPFVTADGKHRGLKKIAKCKIKNRWQITRNGRVEKWSEAQLRPHIIIDLEPIELTKCDKLPF
jgi:hypothetical protein